MYWVNTWADGRHWGRLGPGGVSRLPRHEIAKVSKLLQSQLLQPIQHYAHSAAPHQEQPIPYQRPRPSVLSFNEFIPLFTRNRVALQATGLGGENSTLGSEGVVSGIYNKASFSLGYVGFETDGFRINSDHKDDIADAFLQFESSNFLPKPAFNLNTNSEDTTKRDLQLNFFPDDVLPKFKVTAKTETYRAGLRHAFTPSSIILGSFMCQR